MCMHMSFFFPGAQSPHAHCKRADKTNQRLRKTTKHLPRLEMQSIESGIKATLCIPPCLRSQDVQHQCYHTQSTDSVSASISFPGCLTLIGHTVSLPLRDCLLERQPNYFLPLPDIYNLQSSQYLHTLIKFLLTRRRKLHRDRERKVILFCIPSGCYCSVWFTWDNRQ